MLLLSMCALFLKHCSRYTSTEPNRSFSRFLIPSTCIIGGNEGHICTYSMAKMGIELAYVYGRSITWWYTSVWIVLKYIIPGLSIRLMRCKTITFIKFFEIFSFLCPPKDWHYLTFTLAGELASLILKKQWHRNKPTNKIGHPWPFLFDLVLCHVNICYGKNFSIFIHPFLFHFLSLLPRQKGLYHSLS